MSSLKFFVTTKNRGMDILDRSVGDVVYLSMRVEYSASSPNWGSIYLAKSKCTSAGVSTIRESIFFLSSTK